MKIQVNSQIKIFEPNSQIIEYCNKTLKFANPEYAKKQRMGFWTGNTPQEVYMFYKKDNAYILPFGCFRDIWQIHPVPEDYEMLIKDLTKIDYPEPTYQAYDYQERAIEKMINAKNGILKSPCGSGKSMMAMEIIRRLSGKALFLCHTLDLIKQAKGYAFDHLNLTSDQVGEISGGKVNIGSHITFATRQTMSKVDLSQLKEEWDIIIVDECQHLSYSVASVTEYSRILNALSARYKIGLSATPFNSTGIDISIYALIGRIMAEVTEEEIKDKTIKASIIKKDTDYIPSDDVFDASGIIEDYKKLIDDITSNEERNKMIAKDIIEEYNKGNSCLVLTDRISQLQRLMTLVGQGSIITGKMTSKTEKNKRQEILQEMKDGKQRLLFATYQLAKEGLDIPRLNRLFLASPKKDKATIIQAVGRVERKVEGKETPMVYDYVDVNLKFTNGLYANNRRRIYKKNGNIIYG